MRFLLDRVPLATAQKPWRPLPALFLGFRGEEQRIAFALAEFGRFLGLGLGDVARVDPITQAPRLCAVIIIW